MDDVTENHLLQPLNVGGVILRNRVFLAPMSDVTDHAFRQVAAMHGAGAVYSEMIASEALSAGDSGMALKARAVGGTPHIVQLAGRDAHWLAVAARMAEAGGADIIDINMGCPAKRVVNGYCGSALMREPDHALELIRAVVAAVDIPVTLKMRLGWDHGSLNAPEIAERAQEAGIRLVTVHGRTRCQFYKGEADWEAVAAVRRVTSVPLVVNGDITNRADALQALGKSGADAVMVGRASYGKPWLMGEIAGEITRHEAERLARDADGIVAHYDAILDLYGEAPGIRRARKHLGWYLDSLCLPTEVAPLRRLILTSHDPQEVRDTVRRLLAASRGTAEITNNRAAA